MTGASDRLGAVLHVTKSLQGRTVEVRIDDLEAALIELDEAKRKLALADEAADIEVGNADRWRARAVTAERRLAALADAAEQYRAIADIRRDAPRSVALDRAIEEARKP